MHRCLQISEILTEIFANFSSPSHVTVSTKIRIGRPTLLALSGTCKTFYGPAADLLWQSLEDLTPLLRCLPSDSWVIESESIRLEGRDIQRNTFRLTRVLKMSEWAIIQRHCHRVKLLGMTPQAPGPDRVNKFYTMNQATSDQFLKYLLQSRRSIPKFLPKLVALSWPCSWFGIHTLDLVPHLLGPPLRHLIIYGDHKDSDTASHNVLTAMMRILSILPQYSPSLKRFFYYYLMPDQDDAVSNLLSTVILKCPLLEEVNFLSIPVSKEAFKQLTSLPSLKLLVSLIPTTGYPDLHRSLGPTFPSLHSLDIQVINIQHIQTLLGCIRFPKLDSLAVDLNRTTEVTSDHLKVILDCITQSLSSLRALYIIRTTRLAIALPQPNPDQNLSFTDISHMVNKCRNITRLDLNWPNLAIDLSDDDLRAMALAWRGLQLFQIRCTRPYSPRPNITPKSLLAFATYCPNIRFLSLNLDPSPLNDDLLRQGQEIRHRGHPLRDLRIFVWNELEHPALFSVFILDLFPNVALRVTPICPRRGNEKLWLGWGTLPSFLRNTRRERLEEMNRDKKMQTDE